MNTFRRIYSYKPARLLIKLAICITGVKIVGDFSIYLLSYTNVAFPRYVHLQEYAQSPLNPPIFTPSPVQNQLKNAIENQQFYDYQNKILEILREKKFFMNKLYKYHPQREDPNEIDHFLHYSQASRMMQVMYSRALRKMQNSGTNIAQGINKKLRQLHQYKFNNSATSHIIPQL